MTISTTTVTAIIVKLSTRTDLSGSFIYNEIVTGSVSSTTARVKEWNAVTNKLEISIVSGEFQKGIRPVRINTVLCY